MPGVILVMRQDNKSLEKWRPNLEWGNDDEDVWGYKSW